MDRDELVAKLIKQGEADRQRTVKLSKTKFIAQTDWEQLEPHEKEFLRCYAIGAAAGKAVLVGRSAAVVQKIWTLPMRQAEVELANPTNKPPQRAQWPQGVRYRTVRIPPIDVHTIRPNGTNDNVLVTTRARTAVDMARFHGVRAGVIAMDSLFSKAPRSTHREIRRELEETIVRLSGKRGIENARKALKLSSTRSESPLESLFRLIMLEHEIEFEEQMWLGIDTRPDFVRGQLVVEIDGNVKFVENPEKASLHLIKRDRWIREQNYDVLRIFYENLLDEEQLVRTVLTAIRKAARLEPPLVLPTRNRPRRGTTWREYKAS